MYKVGDFIQLDTWFGDVYAEVVDTFLWSKDRVHITFVQYNKGGTERWTDTVTVNLYNQDAHRNVRRFIAQEDVDGLRELDHAIFSGTTEYRGGWPGRYKLWPSLTKDDRVYTSNHRQKHPDLRG